MALEKYVLTENNKRTMSAFPIGRIKRKRIFVVEENRYNSYGNAGFPKAEVKTKGIPYDEGRIIKGKLIYQGTPGEITAKDALVHQIVKKVIRRDREEKEKSLHLVHPQNHEIEAAYKFLRENFYCFKSE